MSRLRTIEESSIPFHDCTELKQQLVNVVHVHSITLRRRPQALEDVRYDELPSVRVDSLIVKAMVS